MRQRVMGIRQVPQNYLITVRNYGYREQILRMPLHPFQSGHVFQLHRVTIQLLAYRPFFKFPLPTRVTLML